MNKKEKLISIIICMFALNCAEAQQWGDYTFYSIQNSTTANLIDLKGNAYHNWTFSSNSRTGYSSYLAPGGTAIRTVSYRGTQLNGGGITGEVQKVDWNGNVIWDFVHSSATYCLHHDICPLANGNVLMIAYEVKTATQATQAGCSKNMSIWSEKIIEVQPTGQNTGTIVWEWHLWDHLCQNNNSSKDNYVTSILEHPQLLNINYNTQQDWMHMNGIDYNPDLDQIVFSSHYLNEFYVIDHSTTTEQAVGHTGGNSGKGGDFLFRWGNPAAYGATGTKIFNVVHDAHWVPAGGQRANYFAAFNNNGISMQKSSIDLIYPPYDGYNYQLTPGSAFLPSTYNIRFTCNGHTNDLGASQQLPNGNILICVSQTGSIYEIDSTGKTLWSKSAYGSVPNARRYTACYVSGTMAATPTITQNGNNLISSEASTYQWFLDGLPIQGASEQTFTPQKNGGYQVQIKDANGCESELSHQFIVNYISGVRETINKNIFKIYPNPTRGVLYLNSEILKYCNYEVILYNLFGSICYRKNNTEMLDLNILEDGIYYISIKSNSFDIINDKIILMK